MKQLTNLLISLFGVPCAGKGTASGFLAKEGYTELSASSILQDIPRARSFMSRGVLVPPHISVPPLLAAAQSVGGPVIFDGAPRDPEQYYALREMTCETHTFIVFNIVIPDELAYERAACRVVCAKCNTSGQMTNGTTPQCCGQNMVRRDDDDEIQKRVEIYHGKIEPVFSLAVQDGIGIEIDGVPGSENAAQVILEHITSIATTAA